MSCLTMQLTPGAGMIDVLEMNVCHGIFPDDSSGIVGCRGDQFTRLMLKLAAGSSAAIAATGSGGRHLNCLTSTRSG